MAKRRSAKAAAVEAPPETTSLHVSDAEPAEAPHCDSEVTEPAPSAPGLFAAPEVMTADELQVRIDDLISRQITHLEVYYQDGKFVVVAHSLDQMLVPERIAEAVRVLGEAIAYSRVGRLAAFKLTLMHGSLSYQRSILPAEGAK